MSKLVLKGVLTGHGDWVTQIVTSSTFPDTILSASRDKSIIVWQLKDQLDQESDASLTGVPTRALRGHSHFVSDIVLSTDSLFAVSSSWDGSLRLWDLATGTSTRRFVGHKKDVLSVAFSPDNRQIVSAGRDKAIKLWNTIGQCKFDIIEDNHNDWVSCVRFSPTQQDPLIVSAGWDKVVKVWSLTDCKLQTNHYGHNGYLNTVTISPDGTLCASGGRDSKAFLWDLTERRHLNTFDAGNPINALCFSPTRYWLCAATDSSIKLWDLESKEVIAEIIGLPLCNCLTWSPDGKKLFVGLANKEIQIYEVQP